MKVVLGFAENLPRAASSAQPAFVMLQQVGRATCQLAAFATGHTQSLCGSGQLIAAIPQCRCCCRNLTHQLTERVSLQPNVWMERNVCIRSTRKIHSVSGMGAGCFEVTHGKRRLQHNYKVKEMTAGASARGKQGY
jgi:hypothetical protein